MEAVTLDQLKEMKVGDRLRLPGRTWDAIRPLWEQLQAWVRTQEAPAPQYQFAGRDETGYWVDRTR